MNDLFSLGSLGNIDFGFFNGLLVRDFLLQGLLFSLTLTVIASIGGLLLGTLLAIARLSRRRWLSALAAGYVNGMRSIPLVMVILWFFLLIPLIIGQPIGANGSAVITFTAFEAAYFAEIMRAGIQSVSPGQRAAALALGLTPAQSLRRVELPQAIRNMLPVLLTQTIILFQDTSLVYAIGAYDLLKGFDTAGKNFNRPVEAFLLAALVYFVISFSLSWCVRRLHARWSQSGSQSPAFTHELTQGLTKGTSP